MNMKPCTYQYSTKRGPLIIASRSEASNIESILVSGNSGESSVSIMCRIYDAMDANTTRSSTVQLVEANYSHMITFDNTTNTTSTYTDLDQVSTPLFLIFLLLI